MKIIFFGSSYFSARILTFLLEQGHHVALVVTQHPKPAGRHYRQRCTPVEEIARRAGLNVHAPEKVNQDDSERLIRSINADYFVVISYGQILSARLLAAATMLPVAIHPSLLPRYRGASPIQTAVINGDAQTGVTLIKMNSKMDAGDILVQEGLPIALEDTVPLLTERLIDLSGSLLARFFDEAERGTSTLTAQDPALVTLAPKLTKEQGRIDWRWSARVIYDRIRGMLPWPGAFAFFREEQVKIHQAWFSLETVVHSPGTIVALSDTEISVAAGDGRVHIRELQRPGKRKHSAKDFIHGSHPAIGESFR